MSEALDPNIAEIRSKARAHALDWYLAALRAPEHARADLLTLAAFRGEISRIPLEITDAALAEIKLQWWRDAISQGVFGARSGNPIADALAEVLSRHKLPQDLALRAVDGFARELYEDGIEDEDMLWAYAADTEGALGALALGILGASDEEAALPFDSACAKALAVARLAVTLPVHVARGRLPVPLMWRTQFGDPRGGDEGIAAQRMHLITQRLAECARVALRDARRAQYSVSATNFAAFLSVVLVEPYLRAAHARDMMPCGPRWTFRQSRA